MHPHLATLLPISASSSKPGSAGPLSAMSFVSLLLLALAATLHCTTAGPDYYNPWYMINIASVVCLSGDGEQTNSSSSVIEDFGERLDVVLVANDSISDAWIDAADGYAAAADNKILYQTASWSLLEYGTQGGKFSSYWARFQVVNANASSMSMCAMVAEWNSSWKDNKAVLSAVDVMDRLDNKCKENDTVALAFNGPVSNNVIPEAADRLFVRLADGLCPRDESAKAMPVQTDAVAPVISLFRGEVCAPFFGPKTPHVSNEESDHKDSDWKCDLRFIVPVGACVFVLGCAGLVYLLRRHKKESAKKNETAETPKEEDKQDPSSLPSQGFALENSSNQTETSVFVLHMDARSSLIASPTSVSSPHLICAMLVERKADSWSESDATQAAVKVLDRLQYYCDMNDTIILTFTAAVTDSVARFLLDRTTKRYRCAVSMHFKVKNRRMDYV
ncbi:hypothetical protein GN244_ATG07253 [Phytophthora infestans]|uniref:Protein kinase n=1 Tax=Phytophthora infestans TaxID=4787 RepID=A0A833W360_PHYIN|nr:hypothetical protein GN244_ATG07253 [Phytophthora infestans]